MLEAYLSSIYTCFSSFSDLWRLLQQTSSGNIYPPNGSHYPISHSCRPSGVHCNSNSLHVSPLSNPLFRDWSEEADKGSGKGCDGDQSPISLGSSNPSQLLSYGIKRRFEDHLSLRLLWQNARSR